MSDFYRWSNLPISTANPHGYSLLAAGQFSIFTLVLLLLPGCGTAPPVPCRVNIPVYTPCLKAVPARPAFESLALPGDASNGEKVLALARDTVQHFKYEGELEAALAGCL